MELHWNNTDGTLDVSIKIMISKKTTVKSVMTKKPINVDREMLVKKHWQ